MSDADRILALTPADVLGGNTDISADLVCDLKRDEGCRLKAYVDSVGVVTVGYGHAHVEPGTVWTQAQADAALLADIAQAQHLLDARLPWWRSLTQARRDAMTELCFNMGIGDSSHGLLSFHNTLDCIKRGDYERAAVGIKTSKWAYQVRAGRAGRIAEMMRLGHRP